MAQTPPLSSAVPLRCFPAVGDLADAKFACIPARQRKISPRRGSWAGGVLEAVNDAHRRHGVPVALPTTVNAGAYHVDGLACCMLLIMEREASSKSTNKPVDVPLGREPPPPRGSGGHGVNKMKAHNVLFFDINGGTCRAAP